MNREVQNSGFTLVELLISVAITMIIIGAISSALIVFLQNGTYATERDDHSGGAINLASYLNRDLASADAPPDLAVGGACAGAGAGVVNRITLRWTEWSATPAVPEPAATGGTWRASYVVTADPTPVTPTRPQRYQLVRRLCPPTGPVDTTVLVDNLVGTTLSAAATSITIAIPGPTLACAAGAIQVRVPAYLSDTTEAYAYSGCLRGRIR